MIALKVKGDDVNRPICLASLVLLVAACAQQQPATPATDSAASAGRYGELGFLFKGRERLSDAEYDDQVAAASASPLGSAENPVRAKFNFGATLYLDRLRCSDGSLPAIKHNRGRPTPSPYNTIMTSYSAVCSSGTPAKAVVHVDPAHDHVETAAVPGFTIVR